MSEISKRGGRVTALNSMDDGDYPVSFFVWPEYAWIERPIFHSIEFLGKKYEVWHALAFAVQLDEILARATWDHDVHREHEKKFDPLGLVRRA